MELRSANGILGRSPARIARVDVDDGHPQVRASESMHPASFRDLRVIHFLRTEHLDRQLIFASKDAFERFLGLELKGTERVLQEHVRMLTGSRYPF